ncbi:peptide/nickel transport system permease protein [Thermosporothrix hazakensis]|jgi:peptide/nickel transport system permease protein|uniref:Peptide/nickel transport system permease protein n=2 Tax=Thermosporothrix TaxID=768650 RepID=A0A326UC21_THEHA|nr:ABC transporter permease [Thermosporothrix hazakensis]PZW34348.1 peptide/nickel transport system permease protein [Thermosporothrix hazakensis]BBH85470.1 peptide ABC transporter permease [Thermosporothrix sp. COM3]GCE46103.1 peptide ABC transporter permease [Thermosporothrix hazakensis]
MQQETNNSTPNVQEASSPAQVAPVVLPGNVAGTTGKVQSQWKAQLSQITSNTRMMIGIGILLFFILVGLVGPLFARYDPHTLTNDLFQAPSATHWLGTTQKGEDIFARLVYGTRVSLLISFTAAAGSTLLSVLIGLLAGYSGGWVDDVLSFITNIFLVLPGMPLAIVVASFAVKGAWTIILVLLFTSWPWGARVLRAQTLSMRQREFVTAARTLGEKPWRIILFEILPNEIAIVASSFVGTFIFAALSEVALEFLGLGDVSEPSWGVILYWAQTDGALMTGGWWQFVPPGLCVALLCAGLTFINFGIDELANPTLRNERRLARRKKKVA